ncbi:uncharacterized protein LOC126669315 [Mercurialis annua]|uniref:uncharacterized protein LOC126669315 n=1 Tax=Mercurialis annua TaxID=3986 RepID=UPI00215E032B|nr:uncharacterized protein LOC126669315 [Mercurialis annua]
MMTETVTGDQSVLKLEKKDAMKLWLEMKQNGFLTPSVDQMPSRSIQSKRQKNNMPVKRKELVKMQEVSSFDKIVEPAFGLVKVHDNAEVLLSDEVIVMPKRQTKRRVVDPSNRSREVAKVQRLDRFNKLAAPSGLLNEVNPGIINRMRSSEQVYSVIKALVRRDDDQNVRVDCQGKNLVEKDGNECSNSLSRSNELELCFNTAETLSHITKHKEVVADLGVAMIKIEENEGDDVKLSLTSSRESETATSCISSEKSMQTASVDSLSQQGTTIASQWLKCLHQDVTSRLAALRKSQMRVQDVIQTELPLILAREFAVNLENKQFSAAGSPISAVDMHQAKWNSMFHRMDQELSEEANQLEHWLNQVIEIQSHNNHGFQFRDWYTKQILQ